MIVCNKCERCYERKDEFNKHDQLCIGKRYCKTCNVDISKKRRNAEFCCMKCYGRFNKTEDRQNYRKTAFEIYDRMCEVCSIRDERVLQVHHRNKDRKDNKPENLKVLCANCHLIEHYEIRRLNKELKYR